MESIGNLMNTVQRNIQLYESLKNKKKYSSLLKEVLVNNLSEEEINRYERISELQLYLKADKEFAKESKQLLISRSHNYVLIRLILWKLIDILKHVDRHHQVFSANYPNSYLKFPLLKFDMLNMYAKAPELYEEDLDKLMQLLKRKVYKLMGAYKKLNINKEDIAIGKVKYEQELLKSLTVSEITEDQETAAQDDDYQKAMKNIPNSKQLKARSARLVEHCLKREE